MESANYILSGEQLKDRVCICFWGTRRKGDEARHTEYHSDCGYAQLQVTLITPGSVQQSLEGKDKVW